MNEAAEQNTRLEPFFIAQTGELMTESEAAVWLKARMTEAKAKGCQHARYSIHDTIPNLRLVEGWTQTSREVGAAGGDGPQRWQLTAKEPEVSP